MTVRQTLRCWLAEQPFTLAMSSGFFSFFAHGGVLSALEEENLVPAAVSGSSAGALTVGLWAAGLNAGEIREMYLSLRKADFWDPRPGPGLLRGGRFRSLVRAVSPVQRLEQCRRPVGVSTFDLLRMRTRVLTEGDIARSLYASCAVPLMFHPLMHDGGWLVDGGLRDRHGLASVPAGRRVFYHHIAVRSLWRRGNGAAVQVPTRQNMAALVVPGLPRPGPDALHLGRAAWAIAREWALRALDQPVMRGLAAAEEPGQTGRNS